MRKTLLLLVANVALLLLLVEGALRLAPRVIPPGLLAHFEPGLRAKLADGRLPGLSNTILMARDDGGFPIRIWKPGASIRLPFKDPGVVVEVTMDEAGFCNPVGAAGQPSFDVVAIGDSFTWCLNVRPEDTWTNRMAGLSGLSVYNLARSGTGIYEYVQILKQFGRMKSPRIVVMNVYGGNDLRDAERDLNYRRRSEQVRADGEQGAARVSASILTGSALRHSYAANLLTAAIPYVARQIERSGDFRYSLIAPDHTIPFNLDNADQDEILYASKLASGEIGTDLWDRGLESFVEMSRQHGFTPVVTYTPSAHVAYADFVAFRDEELASPMARFDERQRSYLATRVSELGGLYCDLTPALQAAAPSHLDHDNLLYFQTSLHLTQSGHEVIAETLTAFLQNAGLTARSDSTPTQALP